MWREVLCARAEALHRLPVEMPRMGGSRGLCGGMHAFCLALACQAGSRPGWRALSRPPSALAASASGAASRACCAFLLLLQPSSERLLQHASPGSCCTLLPEPPALAEQEKKEGRFLGEEA